MSGPFKTAGAKSGCFRFFFVLFSTFLFLFSLPYFFPGEQRQALAIGVSPTLISLGKLEPGEEREFVVRVFNTRDTVMHSVSCYFVDYRRGPRGELEVLPPQERHEYFSMSRWISPSISFPRSLGPHEGVDVPFRIRVPKDVEPGEKWVGISITGIVPGGIAESGVSLNEEILVQVYGHVGGEGKAQLEIPPVEVRRIGGPFSGRYFFSASIRNTGDSHYFIPDDGCFLRVYGPGGVLVREFEYSSTMVLPWVEGLLPGERIFEGEVDLPQSKPSSYSFVLEVPPLGLSSRPTKVRVIPLWVWVVIGGGTLLLISVFLNLFLFSRVRRVRGDAPRKGETIPPNGVPPKGDSLSGESSGDFLPEGSALGVSPSSDVSPEGSSLGVSPSGNVSPEGSSLGVSPSSDVPPGNVPPGGDSPGGVSDSPPGEQNPGFPEGKGVALRNNPPKNAAQKKGGGGKPNKGGTGARKGKGGTGTPKGKAPGKGKSGGDAPGALKGGDASAPRGKGDA